MKGYQCENYHRILEDNVCDGYADCLDYSDEIGCGKLIGTIIYLLMYKINYVIRKLHMSREQAN